MSAHLPEYFIEVGGHEGEELVGAPVGGEVAEGQRKHTGTAQYLAPRGNLGHLGRVAVVQTLRYEAPLCG